MVSTVSCFLLFATLTLTNGDPHYYNKKGAGLVQNLSNLKGKYGLNFAHSEGMGSLPKNFKKFHPGLKYGDHNPEKHVNHERPADYNNIQMFNLLVSQKLKSMARTRDKYVDEANERSKEFLRICKKKPKEYNCKPIQPLQDSCETSSEDTENENEKKKKRYYRAGDKIEQDTVERDETAILLNDLEKQLLRNGVYKVFVGCVGKKCGSRSNRHDYDEGGGNTEGNRDGCIGDGCGRRRNDDDDTNIKRY